MRAAPLRLWLDHPQGGQVLYDDADPRLMLADVALNADTLRQHGVYEKALLHAFTRTTHATYPFDAMICLFMAADCERLRAAGDPLPGPGPFTVYRGVAGPEPERRVEGLSWTSSLEQARWFAQEHSRRLSEWFTDPDPGVYRVVVPASAVLAYTNREEEEFILFPEMLRPTRIE